MSIFHIIQHIINGHATNANSSSESCDSGPEMTPSTRNIQKTLRLKETKPDTSQPNTTEAFGNSTTELEKRLTENSKRMNKGDYKQRSYAGASSTQEHMDDIEFKFYTCVDSCTESLFKRMECCMPSLPKCNFTFCCIANLCRKTYSLIEE